MPTTRLNYIPVRSNPAIRRADGLEVGEYRAAARTFQSRRDGRRHMLKKPPAWGWDTATLDQAEALGAVYAEITDRDDGTIWRVAIARIRRLGFTRRFAPGQVFLRLSDFGGEKDSAPIPYQLELFTAV